MIFRAVFVIVSLLSLPGWSYGEAALCRLPAPMVEIATPEAQYRVWEMDDVLAYRSDESADRFLLEFRDHVGNRLKPDLPLFPDELKDAIRPIGPYSAEYLEAMAILAPLESLNCLEALLFSEHYRMNPYKARMGHEFQALVLARDGRVRIYFGSNIQGPWVGPSMTELRKQARAAVMEGWRFVFDLHNHPFHFKEQGNPNLGAIPFPSYPDLAAFDRIYCQQDLAFRPLEARITDGFRTSHLKLEDFCGKAFIFLPR